MHAPKGNDEYCCDGHCMYVHLSVCSSECVLLAGLDGPEEVAGTADSELGGQSEQPAQQQSGVLGCRGVGSKVTNCMAPGI